MSSEPPYERYWKIDPHIHCRDWRESYKATIYGVTRKALSKGIGAIFDMPNTDPSILGLDEARKRIRTADQQGVLQHYFLYVAATPSEMQLRRAVRAYEEIDRVVGLKLYTAPMKDLEARGIEEQSLIYRVLTDLDYRGVLAIHCEKYEMLSEKLWDPSRPYTWNSARPPEAEVECVKQQLFLAERSYFKGTIYFVHISTPESVLLIRRAKERGINVVCGVTPHHLIFDTDHMRSPESVVLKVNPPIREKTLVDALRRLVASGHIDFLETDHAPHSPSEKVWHPYLSGIRSLEIYDEVLRMLIDWGASENVIYMMTRRNAERIFNKVEDLLRNI
jgi:dihydroorotase